MSNSQNKEIQDAFDKASLAIYELEEVIRIYHDTPKDNINSLEFKKIGFPSGYIRTRSYFASAYNLNYLIGESKQRDSIAYSLMQSDLHNYFINRIQVWGIVKMLLLKGAIINLVSVIEGILMCSIGQLHKHCRIDEVTICKNQNRCGYYVKSSKHLKIIGAIEILKHKLLLTDVSILADINLLNEIRNNVHLSILERHEFVNDDYSIINYNKAIRALNYLKVNQRLATEGFIGRRDVGCLGLVRP
ncbi:MAG: hypothetical protein EOO47_04985 [Flavobacterium sp.]|nr:MAG: hypothetical protein EOO47_04985 [Flavobacterium sp.]